VNAKVSFAYVGNTLECIGVSAGEGNAQSMAGPNQGGDGHHRESHSGNPSRRQRLSIAPLKTMVRAENGVGRSAADFSVDGTHLPLGEVANHVLRIHILQIDKEGSIVSVDFRV
jgi:hypothetical protein